ncbi:MAG: response regulator [bacterium]|jgi:two-component system response regulator VicR|nr:response regulator [Bacillota bacterium]HHW56035.1 response regulator transcription factor [Bacillota bacterium]
MTEKILVVDDEKPIADILRYNLEQAGYEVVVAYDGEEAVAKAKRDDPDLMILDIMLPKLDGFSVCRQVRTFSQVPILMLTAKEEELDKILGLELGADDYVTKPFSPREIVARVKAILRRVQTASEQQGGAPRVLDFGELQIDLERVEARKGSQTLELTPREFDLLKHMALSPGRVFSREQLLEEVWGFDYYGDIRTVDVAIRRLREKLEDDPSNPRYIQTRRGAGYYFRGN